MTSRLPLPGDEVLVRHTSRQLAVRASALVALAMLLLVVLVTVVVVRGQSASAVALLRTTAVTADDVGDPPAGTWLALTASGGTTVSPGLPKDLGEKLEQLRKEAGGRVLLTELHSPDGDEYRVATLRRTQSIVQVVQDLTTEHAGRDRLLKAMALGSALALAFALGLGLLLGRRAVRPFAHALALQRAFVADASHELRTPLTLLSTRAQLLDAAVQDSALPEQVRADSTAVIGDIHRLGEVLEDLLVAADPRNLQEVAPVRVDTIAKDCVASATAHARAAGVDLRFEEPERFASGPDDRLHVLAASAALRRAVLALIDNAIDHTPRGGEVIVSSRQEGRSVVLAVSDTGPGVAPEAAPDLLRRFHSGGQRAGRAHYGLGLALTHDVANRLGGQLRLAKSAAGATFELVLPVADVRLTGS